MNKRQARSVIAHYITGTGRFDEETIGSALAVLRMDRRYGAHLRETLGLEGPRMAACESFTDCVDEACEIGMERLQAEAPQLAEHMAGCETCRSLYWDIHGLWADAVKRTESPSPAAAGVLRRLSSALSVLLDEFGAFAQSGWGPVATRTTPTFATLDASEPGAPADPSTAGGPKGPARWRLEDPESACAIMVELRPGRHAELFLDIDLERDSDETPKPDPRIEIRDGQKTLLHAGSLSSFRREPYRLPPGDFEIRLTLDGDDHLGWIIPIVIADGRIKGP